MNLLFAGALLAIASLLPLLFAGRAALRGRREAALALHRLQLAEIDNDLQGGRIPPEEHAAAKLEVQRRLLASANLEDAPIGGEGKRLLLALCLTVPLAAGLLYKLQGEPSLIGAYPSPPAAPAAQQPIANAPAPPPAANGPASRKPGETSVSLDEMVRKLRAELATMDPHSRQALHGYLLFARIALDRGNLPDLEFGWRHALAIQFDPATGAALAEVIATREKHLTPEAIALFQRALREAPKDVSWRELARKRLLDAHITPEGPP